MNDDYFEEMAPHRPEDAECDEAPHSPADEADAVAGEYDAEEMAPHHLIEEEDMAAAIFPGPGVIRHHANLRMLRAEIQAMQSVLVSIGKGETSPQDHVAFLAKAVSDVEELLHRINEEDFKSDGMEDHVRKLHNTWELMRESPLLTDPERDFDPQAQLHQMNRLGALCRQMVFQLGYLTIPDRVQEWLDVQFPGNYVPFHPVFEDELPSLEDRVKLLNLIAWQPKILKRGIVDVPSGVIYRHATGWFHQLLFALGVIVALAASVGIVIGACYLPASGWIFAPGDVPTLLVAWGAVLAGVIVHIAVATAKRSQAEGRPPVIVPAQFLPSISAKFGQILLKLFLVLIGLFGFALAAGDMADVTVMNSFLVGYSLDSVVELFGTSIEKQSAAQLASLKKDLGVVGD